MVKEIPLWHDTGSRRNSWINSDKIPDRETAEIPRGLQDTQGKMQKRYLRAGQKNKELANEK